MSLTERKNYVSPVRNNILQLINSLFSTFKVVSNIRFLVLRDGLDAASLGGLACRYSRAYAC
jgi:hypothetical protein